MRLNLRWPSRAEDRFEKWIAQRHQARVLAGETTPLGSCPDEAFLRNLARKSHRIALADPRVNHAATCPACMTRLLTLHRERRSRQRKLVLATAAVTCLLIVAGVVSVDQYEAHKQSPVATMAAVSKTVNLWDAGTFRSEQPRPLQSVMLPAALVRLTIILPRFSAAGQYVVAVTHDQNGNGVVAQNSAVTVSSGDKEIVSLDLDLRKAKAGQYFLATTHEQDQAAYYYPLQIK